MDVPPASLVRVRLRASFSPNSCGQISEHARHFKLSDAYLTPRTRPASLLGPGFSRHTPRAGGPFLDFPAGLFLSDRSPSDANLRAGESFHKTFHSVSQLSNLERGKRKGSEMNQWHHQNQESYSSTLLVSPVYLMEV